MRHCPTCSDQDIIGSPYCVHRYVADERFGGPAGLAAARAALAARGVRLILDYVPNHVAPDHPWVTEHPEFFIQGDDDDVKVGSGWLAARWAGTCSPTAAILTSRRGRTSCS